MKWRGCPDENETSPPDAAGLYHPVFLLHVSAHRVYDRVQLQPEQGLCAVHRVYAQVVHQPVPQRLHPAGAGRLGGSGPHLGRHRHHPGHGGFAGHRLHGPQEPPCGDEHHLYPGRQPGDHHRHLADAALRGLPAFCGPGGVPARYHHGPAHAAHRAHRVQRAVCHLQRHAQAQAAGHQAV